MVQFMDANVDLTQESDDRIVEGIVQKVKELRSIIAEGALIGEVAMELVAELERRKTDGKPEIS